MFLLPSPMRWSGPKDSAGTAFANEVQRGCVPEQVGIFTGRTYSGKLTMHCTRSSPSVQPTVGKDQWTRKTLLFEDSAALEAHLDALSRSCTWTEEVRPELSELESRREDQPRTRPHSAFPAALSVWCGFELGGIGTPWSGCRSRMRRVRIRRSRCLKPHSCQRCCGCDPRWSSQQLSASMWCGGSPSGRPCSNCFGDFINRGANLCTVTVVGECIHIFLRRVDLALRRIE